MADEENENNPFSFSNFLGRRDDVDGSLAIDKDLELPLVYDEANGSNSNPFSIRNFQSSPSQKKKNPKKLQIVEDDDHVKNVEASNDLPDFEKNNSDSDSDNDSFTARSPSPQMDSYVLDETTDADQIDLLTKLSSENEDLRNEMKIMKEEFLEYRQTANRRISNLQKELEKARKKEADEAQSLENVVHMVEENLQSTTTRAIKAEASVARLKEELHLYREGTVSQFEYEKLLREHTYLLNTIQEKSRNAALLMRRAAEKTAPHIRQLQSGIQSLYFLSDQFDEIGQISELPYEKKKEDDVT